MYAVVDIETTGGHASANGITEIAILIHDGQQIIERFESLLNPRNTIPIYIESLTGISNQMVQNAPHFETVAQRIHELLHDKVFVAHNVNFDYSFLKYHLEACGLQLNTKKLCTVRLSRKILPGLNSYSLGRLCSQVGISLTNRHRAMGDAEATACLLTMLLENDKDNFIKDALNPRSKEQLLPPNLARQVVNDLPFTPGVYYFHNRKGKVIYVGKARNIRKRVNSHFANNKPNKQKQDFLREIYNITYQECGTELYSLILEAVEIKRLWPAFNRSLKRFEHRYGLYTFEDQSGFMRLAVDKTQKHSRPVYTFNGLLEGHNLIRQIAGEFKLCPKLCFINTAKEECAELPDGTQCSHSEGPAAYNVRVAGALKMLRSNLPSFMLFDEGRNPAEKSCMLMEAGIFYGMGYIEAHTEAADVNTVREKITPYISNDYIRNMVTSYASSHPEKVVWLNEPVQVSPAAASF